jgi:ABC-type transport system substrate-binding protein
MHLATNYVANQEAFWGKGFFHLGGVLNNAHAEGISQEELLTMPGWRVDKTEDLQTANDLIAAAGFPQGEGLSFEFMGNTIWEAYGYNFSIRQMDDWRSAFPEIDVEGLLSADATAHIEALTNGGFDVSHLPIGSSSPASSDLGQYTTGAGNNFSGYSNPELDALVARANAKFIPSEASEDVLAAQRILLEDMPQLIDHRLHQSGIYAPDVRGFPILPGGTEPLAGNFENWDTIARHAADLWLA